MLEGGSKKSWLLIAVTTRPVLLIPSLLEGLRCSVTIVYSDKIEFHIRGGDGEASGDLSTLRNEEVGLRNGSTKERHRTENFPTGGCEVHGSQLHTAVYEYDSSCVSLSVGGAGGSSGDNRRSGMNTNAAECNCDRDGGGKSKHVVGRSWE